MVSSALSSLLAPNRLKTAVFSSIFSDVRAYCSFIPAIVFFKAFSLNSDIAYSSWYDVINENADCNYYINGKNVVLYGIEEAYVADIMNYPLEGSYPQTEKEIAISADAKELFNVQTGDNIMNLCRNRDKT